MGGLGEHIFPRYIELKRKEDDYRVQLTAWEMNRYLKALCTPLGTSGACPGRVLYGEAKVAHTSVEGCVTWRVTHLY